MFTSSRRLRDVEIETSVRVPMRDGCMLAADIYRPARPERPLPVLLLRIPYDRRVGTEVNYAPPPWYARQGFIVVVQDTRGRFDSEGAFVPFVHEAMDGYDSIEWAARLEGSNGRVGTYGASYAGYCQLLTAATRPPALGAICPAIAGSDLHKAWIYEGGALSLAFAASWAVELGLDMARRAGNRKLEDELEAVARDPLRWYASASPYELEPIASAIPFYREWLDHPKRDEYWIRWSVEQCYDRIEVPALHIGGWYDIFNDGTIENFVHLAKQQEGSDRERQRLLVGPWAHVPWGTSVGEVDFGADATGWVADRAQAAFLRRHLDPEAQQGELGDAVRYFVLFENAWRSADSWPPGGVSEETWYLHSDGNANSSAGDGRLDRMPPSDEAYDVYAYNPEFPAPSNGGHSCCFEATAPMGPRDQYTVEQRKDILVYTSSPLERDLLLAGPVRLVVWVETNAPDADYTGKLCIGDGDKVINIAEGNYRATAELSEVQTGGPVRLEVHLRNVATLVRPGQFLRLEVTSGSFPMYDINPQSGSPAARTHSRDFLPAMHAVLHDTEHRSFLTLSVMGHST